MPEVIPKAKPEANIQAKTRIIQHLQELLMSEKIDDPGLEAAWKQFYETKLFILQFFEYKHLPPHLSVISKQFHDLAHALVYGDNCPESGTVSSGPPLPRNQQRDVALEKLLEAKDAAVRAALAK